MLHICGKKIDGGPALISSISCIALHSTQVSDLPVLFGWTLQELSKMDLPDNDAVKSLMLRALLTKIV